MLGTFYGVWPEVKDIIPKKIAGLTYTVTEEKLSLKNIDPKTEVLVVFVDSPVTREILNKLPNLKLITTMSTGYDHIDLAECGVRKITVCNVPTYGEHTVAEHTFALILGLTRKLFPSVKRVKEGVYDFHGLRGVDIVGKTLGVIGTGKIGSNVITMAKAFGMNVIAFDRFPNQTKADEIGFTYTTLPKLLSTADIVTLHTPLTPNTKHLLNKKNIQKIKKGSYIINTARGALIEPEALVYALQNNLVAGVGLDVLEDEDMLQDEEKIISGEYTEYEIKNSVLNNYIIEHPNSIVTPHNAFNSKESLQRIMATTTDNIQNFLHQTPKNVVK